MSSSESNTFYNPELDQSVKVDTVTKQGENESMDSVIQGFKDEYQDNTDYLRQVKRSATIRDEVLKMERMKRTYTGDKGGEEFAELCKHECNYLFTHNPLIFNKMLKDVLDLKLLFVALDTLRKIEEGLINQEQGSVLMGKQFADMYLDSSRREGDALDAAHADDRPEPVEGKAISWKQYKLGNRRSLRSAL